MAGKALSVSGKALSVLGHSCPAWAAVLAPAPAWLCRSRDAEGMPLPPGGCSHGPARALGTAQIPL